MNTDGDTVRFIDDGQNSVSVTIGAVSSPDCTWGITPDRADGATIVCADGTEGGYFFGAAVPGGDLQALLIFLREIWYKRCG